MADGDEIDLEYDYMEEPEQQTGRHARIEAPTKDDDEDMHLRDESREEAEMDILAEDRPAVASSQQQRNRIPWDTQAEEARKRAQEKAKVQLTGPAMTTLYAQLNILDVDPLLGSFSRTAVTVKGCDDMKLYQVEKMFAAYRPYRVEMLNNDTYIVHFLNRSEAAAMMLGQTKRLRRVRAKKTAEEGEVMESSDEEDGELKTEGGDDVAVDQGEAAIQRKSIKEDSVEVNIDEVQVPPGKWRVVTRHVTANRLCLVRFARDKEIREARKTQTGDESGSTRKRRGAATRDEYGDDETWSQDKARPGLNIFDKDGNELDWDYEHDTRFYEDLDNAEDETEADVKAIAAWPSNVKVRGRGAKNARFGLIETTMKADKEESVVPKKRSRAIGTESALSSRISYANDEDEEEDDLPWDQPSTSSRLKGRVQYK